MEEKRNRIAVISITLDDGYKIDQWHQYYEEYKSEIALHVIVDNGSSQSYIAQLKSLFPDSLLIERKTNGGCTIAYNDGIRAALAQKEITHIALMANDIKLQKGALSRCVEVLDSNENLGMVEPVLLEKDSDIINDFGCTITKHLFMNAFMKGKSYKVIQEKVHYATTVTGGMNIAKRSFYESIVGLQDEKLFMYSDEVDMGLRAQKAGVKMAAVGDALAWHQHINPPGNSHRLPYSKYLIARNKVYLGRKHFGVFRSFSQFLYFQHKSFMGVVLYTMGKGKENIKDQAWQFWGAVNGLFGNMKPNRFSHM